MGNYGVAAERGGNKRVYGGCKTEEYTRYQTLTALLYWKHILCVWLLYCVQPFGKSIQSSDFWHHVGIRKRDDSMYECTVFQAGALSRILRFITLIKISPNRCSASHCEDPGLIPGQSVWDGAQCGNGIDFPVSTSVFPCQLYKTSTSIPIHLSLTL